MRHFSFREPFLVAIVLAVASVSFAAEVTNYVPDDALGFVVVRQMKATSERAESITRMFDAPVPPMLAFLKLQTGFSAGLNEQGDMLLAMLPGQHEFAAPGPLAMIPVTDYGDFVGTFEGDQSGDICPVTIAGEDVLVARRGDFAMFMNPEYREQMQKILASEPKASETVKVLDKWIDANNAAVVILPPGAKMLVAMAKSELATARTEMEQGFEDLEMEQELATIRAAFKFYGTALEFMGDEITSAALGLAIDEGGNLKFGLRALATADGGVANIGSIDRGAGPLSDVPAGEFVMAGGGPWPKKMSDALMGFSVEIMKTMPELYGLDEANEQDYQRLHAAFEKSMQGLKRGSFLMRPGRGEEPIYSNMFGVMHVTDAKQYMTNYAEAMKIWNEISQKGAQDAKFEYNVTEEQIAGKEGIKITMDFSEMFGAQGLPPQFDTMMEKMFGEGGKMRAYVAPVDDERVVIGYGVKSSVEQMIESLRESETPLSQDDHVAVAKKLLPADAAIGMYISPKGCVDWARRFVEMMMAQFGGGGPEIPEYPATPPVGVSFQINGRVLETDVVAPNEMLKGLSEYIRNIPW